MPRAEMAPTSTRVRHHRALSRPAPRGWKDSGSVVPSGTARAKHDAPEGVGLKSGRRYHAGFAIEHA